MAVTPEPDDPAGIAIPDDASALDADRWRYYEELAAENRLRHAPGQPTAGDHPGRWRDGLPWFGHRGSHVIPFLFIVAAVLAMVGTLMLASVTRVDAPVSTAPLAADTSTTGVVGGLMPSAAVAVNGAPRLLRDIRPAVVALVPSSQCPECAAGIASAAAQAEAAGFRFLVAAEGRDVTEVSEYAAPVGAASMLAPVTTFADFRPSGLTLFVVAPDGVVADVVRGADETTSLAATLGQATTTGA